MCIGDVKKQRCKDWHWHWLTFAFSASLAALPVRKTVSDGVFGFFEMLMISLRRGTPSVTFFADTPA